MSSPYICTEHPSTTRHGTNGKTLSSDGDSNGSAVQHLRAAGPLGNVDHARARDPRTCQVRDRVFQVSRALQQSKPN